MPAPGEPAKEVVNPQSRVKKVSRESEFPGLGPAIHLAPSFYSQELSVTSFQASGRGLS